MATEDPKKKGERPDKMEVLVDNTRTLNGEEIEQVHVGVRGDKATGEIVITMTVRTVGRDADGARRLCHRVIDDAFEVGAAIDHETGSIRRISSEDLPK